MDKSEMGAKIQNAVRSIGVEEGFRRGFKRPDLEFKVYDFGFLDASCVGPHNTDAFMEHKKERRKNITEFLNDGWWLTDKIICPPNVMLIFCREKERNDDRRQ